MRFLFRCKEFFAAATNYNAPAENKPGRGTENKPISFHHAMRAHHHKYLQIHMPQLPVGAYLKAEPPLVTGASSGIGKAIAIALGAAGANVCVNYVTGHGQGPRRRS